MTRFTTVLGALALAALGASAFIGTTALTAGEAAAQEVDTSTVAEMTLGDENAPVEVIEYASYTCPHCRDFHEGNFKKLKSEYIDTGKVHFIYREVYFDRFGLWASMIARCAGPERFFGVTDLLYERQDEWSRAGNPAAIVEELRKIGRLAGLENDQLEACLQDGETAQTLVTWYQQNAEEHDITGTPSFIVNGQKVSNLPWDDFKSVLEEELGS